jgi:hypothetical protein
MVCDANTHGGKERWLPAVRLSLIPQILAAGEVALPGSIGRFDAPAYQRQMTNTTMRDGIHSFNDYQ